MATSLDFALKMKMKSDIKCEEDKASSGQSVADDNHRLHPQWHGQGAYAAMPGLGKQMVGTSLQSRKGTWNWEGK